MIVGTATVKGIPCVLGVMNFAVPRRLDGHGRR
jgi:hypothetical protein